MLGSGQHHKIGVTKQAHQKALMVGARRLATPQINAARQQARSLVETILAYDGRADPGFSLRGSVLGKAGENIGYISQQAGVRIQVEGQDSSDLPPVSLRITGSSEASMKEAMLLVRELLEKVRADHDRFVSRQIAATQQQRNVDSRRRQQASDEETLVVYDGVADPSFSLRGAVLGKGGENIRYIQQQTGVRIKVEGHDSQQPVVLRVERCRGANIEEAMAMARELVESVRTEHDNFIAKQRARQCQTDRVDVAKRRFLAEAQRLRDNQANSKEVKVERQAKLLEQRAQALTGSNAEIGTDGAGGFCTLYPLGACPFTNGCCPRGRHSEPQAPAESEVLVRVTRAKKRLLQQKWADAGGYGDIANVWQVHNPRLEFLFRSSECNFAKVLGHGSDVIDGWHGTSEENVLSIAMHGFDPKRRSGQVYGEGEYFAKDPNVSVSYARGGSFMLLCKLLLGVADLDHSWVDSCKYYVLKQRDFRIQVLPLFVIQFQESDSGLTRQLSDIKKQDIEDAGTLAVRQRGGLQPCKARRDAGMSADCTQHLWVGWLAPELCGSDDDEVADDVKAFLSGFVVSEVLPERNGARIGAFVLLKQAIDRVAFSLLQGRLYRGEFRISVDDQQPNNPRYRGKTCPRLLGPSHFCRGWNIRGHHSWQWGCPFDHPEKSRATFGATYSFLPVVGGTAKYDEIETDLSLTAPFTSSSGHAGTPRIVAVQRVVNKKLERLYEERRGFLHDKQGFVVEKELWHGTSCKALPELLTHGLQPPSDTSACAECPRSGGKGLCTSLCGTDCRKCREPHAWGHCHMYGLGVYLADQAQKSHRYVREPDLCRLPGVARRWQTVLAGKWRFFDDELQSEFERAYAAEEKIHKFKARSWSYDLDFDRMVQVNLSTTRERPVRRLDDADIDGDCIVDASEDRHVYSMLRCRVVLGNPYLIEGNLLRADAMHDLCWCQNPADALESCPETWEISKGHDAFYIRGQAGAQKAGLGVYNSEYVVFQPYQILPLYKVDYILE